MVKEVVLHSSMSPPLPCTNVEMFKCSRMLGRHVALPMEPVVYVRDLVKRQSAYAPQSPAPLEVTDLDCAAEHLRRIRVRLEKACPASRQAIHMRALHLLPFQPLWLQQGEGHLPEGDKPIVFHHELQLVNILLPYRRKP